jgi:hypothetical protein
VPAATVEKHMTSGKVVMSAMEKNKNKKTILPATKVQRRQTHLCTLGTENVFIISLRPPALSASGRKLPCGNRRGK